MKCEQCNEREATILFTQISGDEKATRRLCAQCASIQAQHQQATTSGTAQAGDPGPADPGKTGVVKKVNVVVGHLSSSATPTACSQCGMTYDEFRKTGRFGCGECYNAFGAQLDRLFKRIHGATRHGGKGPGPAAPVPAADELEALRQALQQAVEEEAYEKAASIRDRITNLERLSNSEASDRP